MFPEEGEDWGGVDDFASPGTSPGKGIAYVCFTIVCPCKDEGFSEADGLARPGKAIGGRLEKDLGEPFDR